MLEPGQNHQLAGLRSEVLGLLPVKTVVFSPTGEVLYRSQGLTFEDILLHDVFGRLSLSPPESRFQFVYGQSAEGPPVRWSVVGKHAPGIGWIAQMYEERPDPASAREEQENFFLRRMISVFAHEFRNPLAAVRLSLDYATSKLSQLGWLQPDLKLSLSRGLRSVQTLDRMIVELLDFERWSSGHFGFQKERLSLVELVSEAVATWRQRAPNPIELHLDSTTPIVFGDADRLRQLIDNLMHNAVKFSARTQPIQVKLTATAEHALLRIRDQGAGLDSHTLRHIEHAFFQGNQDLARSRGGLGLGAFIVSKIAEGHEARVTYSSEGPGKGTTVSIALPLSRGGTLAEVPVEAPSVTADPGEKRVLFVEDDDDLRECYQMAIELETGLRTDFAASAEEALELFQRHRHELVISDIGLPGLNGYQLAQRLRALSESNERPKILLISGYDRDFDRQRSTLLQVQAHLRKPISLDELLALIRRELNDG